MVRDYSGGYAALGGQLGHIEEAGELHVAPPAGLYGQQATCVATIVLAQIDAGAAGQLCAAHSAYLHSLQPLPLHPSLTLSLSPLSPSLPLPFLLTHTSVSIYAEPPLPDVPDVSAASIQLYYAGHAMLLSCSWATAPCVIAVLRFPSYGSQWPEK
ncbi:hypothetical protein B484DRAFT_1270 [Ochromonadaceae sp. CCMP2298]|nr:hypothetical protein B484DRAFT_1270 [Ochromonadaceae sp. CCMP2298]